jgi:hypothetical protein
LAIALRIARWTKNGRQRRRRLPELREELLRELLLRELLLRELLLREELLREELLRLEADDRGRLELPEDRLGEELREGERTGAELRLGEELREGERTGAELRLGEELREGELWKRVGAELRDGEERLGALDCGARVLDEDLVGVGLLPGVR